MSARDRAYRFVRTKLPSPIRRMLKALPGMRTFADESRPTGDLWLPVHLGEGLDFKMLLPEGFHWVSYDGYEREPVAWVVDNLHEGSTCLDVGGHVGVYALLMGRLAGSRGRVLTFEPVPSNAAMLRQNVDENRLRDQVSVVEAATDIDDGGTLTLHTGGASSEASVHSHGTRPDQLEVTRVSLDAAAGRAGLERIDLIKMDIEGAEEHALRGAERILERSSPTLLLEVHGAAGVGGLAFLESLGYRASLLDGSAVSAAGFPDRIIQVVATRP